MAQDIVTRLFLRFLERQERRGRAIPEELLDAREEILAPEAEPSPIPAVNYSSTPLAVAHAEKKLEPMKEALSEVSHDVVSDMSWNSAIEALREYLKTGHEAVYNYDLGGSAFRGLSGAIDKVVAAGHPRAPFDALLTAIDSLNGRSGDWTTTRSYQVALNRVIIRDERAGM